MGRTERKDKWHRWEFTHSRQIDDFEENLYFIIILLPFTPAPYKSIWCRWERCLPLLVPPTYNDTLHSKLFHNVSPTHSPLTAKRERKRVELIFWCFDKVKCHWEAKILLKASFAAFYPSHSTWIMRTLFRFFMKNLCFYCFRRVEKKGKTRFKKKRRIFLHCSITWIIWHLL